MYLCLGFKKKDILRDLGVDARIMNVVLKSRIPKGREAAFIALRREKERPVAGSC